MSYIGMEKNIQQINKGLNVNSGGLYLNYGKDCELGMNEEMLKVFVDRGVIILTASDARSPNDVGANIQELQNIIYSLKK